MYIAPNIYILFIFQILEGEPDLYIIFRVIIKTLPNQKPKTVIVIIIIITNTGAILTLSFDMSMSNHTSPYLHCERIGNWGH
jgi:hypothetical protein